MVLSTLSCILNYLVMILGLVYLACISMNLIVLYFLELSNKTPTAVVAPVQSMTVKPLKLGHSFEPHELTDWVTWCDACGSIILSIFGKCVSCKSKLKKLVLFCISVYFSSRFYSSYIILCKCKDAKFVIYDCMYNIYTVVG